MMQQMFLGHSSSSGGGGWEILFAASSKSTTDSSKTSLALNPWAAAGNSSGNLFPTATSSNTGASGRINVNSGVGVYNAFFNKTGITKIAIASHHDGSGNTNMTPGSGGNFARWIIYDLVGSMTNSVYTTINTLNSYNLNNPSWAGNDTVFGTNSVNNFVAGPAYSGQRSSDSGHYKTENNATPEYFAVWGVNRDSDNDTQVLCAYYGNLTSGKADSWRGNNPKESFFSFWGNDWHSNTQTQTISKNSQTSPGFNVSTTVNASVGGSTSEVLYMLAF